MASRLKNIVRFTAGGPTTLPHNLNNADVKLIPDLIELDAPGVTATADATNVTISGSITVDVLVESWHTIEREFGAKAITDLVPQPFVVNGGGGGVLTDIVFRPYSTIPSHDNVFTTWAEVVSVIAATATLGTRNLYFDFLGSPTFGPPSYGNPSWMMPGGVWDMKNIVWKDIPSNSVGFDGGNTLFFSDNCKVKNLSKVDGSALFIMNTSTTNTPIEMDAGCFKLHLSGFVQFCNDSIAEYAPNPNAKPVIKFTDPAVGSPYQIYSDSPQAMLGLYGQGPETFQDTNTPPPPILDINGCFSFLRCQFNTKAVNSFVPGAVLIIERVSDEIACGFHVQNWEFVNPENIAFSTCGNMTRVSYWTDNNQNGPNVGYGVISAAKFNQTPRSGNYQPYPPADATYYLAIHNQCIFCDPTAAGSEGEVKLVIELPTAKLANGEVIKIVDVTGAASVGSPIIVRAKAGEFIINGAAPAASVNLTTAWVAKEFICDGMGQWIAT